jgi:cytochrome c-type biogenesis protein CcmH/NrfG
MDLPEKIRLGIGQFEKGNFDEARARFQAVLKVNPQEPVALDYLKRISEAQTKVSTLEDLQKDKDVWALYLDGLRYMRNKEYEKAIEVWSQVLQAYPNNPNTLNNIEQARLRLKTEQPGK